MYAYSILAVTTYVMLHKELASRTGNITFMLNYISEMIFFFWQETIRKEDITSLLNTS